MTRRTLGGVALGVVSACLSSCSTTALEVVAEPPLGEVRTVDVGGTLIKLTTLVKSPAFDLRSELEATTRGDFTTTHLTLSPGILVGKELAAGQDCYVSDQPPKISPAMGELQVRQVALCFDRSSFGSSVVLAFMQDGSNVPFYLVGPVDGEVITYVDDSIPSFSQDLIYGGRSGHNVKVIYRQFSSKTAAHPPDQETQYDLNTSHLIEVKGARLEVVQATDTSLTYKVLARFPQAVMDGAGDLAPRRPSKW